MDGCHLYNGVTGGGAVGTFSPVAICAGTVPFCLQGAESQVWEMPALLSFCSCRLNSRSVSTKAFSVSASVFSSYHCRVSPGREADPDRTFAPAGCRICGVHIAAVCLWKGTSPSVWSCAVISSLRLLPLGFGKRREASSTRVPSGVVNLHRQLDRI